ncbi:uncharacterized protein LOC141674301 [Apium graveolens]|uniref:uncharacterized protein LOC141674301 n=1 Tax=Apium graveolens TaxID=4045 RepID=UPI003D799690
MVPIRKYKWRGEKRKEKRRREALQKTHVGSLDKYFLKNTVENVVVDEMDIGYSINSDVNNATVVENQFVNDENENENVNENENQNSNGIEDDSESEEENEKLGAGDNFSFDVDDPGYWSIIENNKIEFLVERGPKRVKNVTFPKDIYDMSFSSRHYIRDFPNGEKRDRKWLIYSVVLDKVFCFCCKLFAQNNLVGRLGEEDINDWYNISQRLRSLERNSHHIESIVHWVELDKRLKLSVTIDSTVQEKITREEALETSVRENSCYVKRLGRNNLAFRGNSEKIYENNNEFF